MIDFNCYDDEVKKTFEKYLRLTRLNRDFDLYHRVMAIEKDVKFFQEFIDRTQKKSGYSFEPRISMRGFTYNDFLSRINRYFNYYDYKYLNVAVYVFEILRILFARYWNEGVGVNPKCVKRVLEFHKVVEYHLGIENPREYVGDFIGSSYAIKEFITEMDKQSELKEVSNENNK